MERASSPVRPFGALTSKFAIDWRVHLAFAVPAISSGIFNDYGRLGGDPVTWILLTVLGYLATVATIELLLQLADKLGIRRTIPMMLSVLVLAGLTRGLSIYLIGTLLSTVPYSDFGYRLLGAPIYVVSTYLIFNTVVAAFLQQREAEVNLRSEKSNLAQSRMLFSEEIQRLRLERKSKIQQMIAPSIWEISKLLTAAKVKGDTSGLVSALREANESVVRPLSHSLSQYFETPTLSTITPLSRVGRLTLPKRVTLGDRFSVFMLIAFSLAMGYSTQALSVGLVGALTNVVVSGSYFAVVIYLIKYATAKIEHSTWLGLVLSSVIGAGVGYSSVWLLNLPTLGFDPRFPSQAVLFFALSFPSLYLLAAFNAQRDLNLRQLEKTVADLKLLNSQLRQQVWLDQKLLATELHGSVQATLHATALSLANNKKPSVEDLDKVMTSVTEVIERLGQGAYLEGSSFAQVLQDIQLVWEDSCEIEIDVSECAAKVLEQDPKAARSVIEVVRENITNAIKHNRAETIEVLIDKTDQLIEVVITNPGELGAVKDIGLGSEILSELTLEYHLNQVGPLVMLRALIPLSLADES